MQKINKIKEIISEIEKTEKTTAGKALAVKRLKQAISHLKQADMHEKDLKRHLTTENNELPRAKK